MTAPPLTRDEALLVRWMQVCIVLYGGTTLVFLFGHSWLFLALNAAGRMLGLPDTPQSTERFWLSLTISMMVMLVVCCAFVVRDVRRYLDFCIPIVFGKVSGAAVALVFFFLWQPYPAHVTVAITDVPLGIVTYILWRRVKRTSPSPGADP